MTDTAAEIIARWRARHPVPAPPEPEEEKPQRPPLKHCWRRWRFHRWGTTRHRRVNGHYMQSPLWTDYYRRTCLDCGAEQEWSE